MKEYAVYLFDADGTVIDTQEMIVQSFWVMEDEMGVPRHDRAYLASLIGLPSTEQMRILLGSGQPEERYEQALAAYRASNGRLTDTYLRLFDGAADVLARLHGMGKRLGVVTSRYRRSLIPFMTTLGVWQYFDAASTPEDTQLHKPNPDPVLDALAKLGAAPQDAVMIGDASFDIECGARAGVDTVLVAWGGMDPSGWAYKPGFVAQRFADLLPEGA